MDAPSTPQLAPHQLCNQTSFNTEIYTPPEITDMAREVMGGIDLDSASSPAANRTIKATVIYTEPPFDVVGEEGGLPIRRYASWGGLAREWHGRIWLNPPFGSPESRCRPECSKKGCQKRGWHTDTNLPGMEHWVNHFVGEHRAGRMTEGLMICFAATSEGWFQPLLQLPQCFPRRRTNYHLPDGSLYKGVTKGSVITYVGPNVDRFAEVFGRIGTVKVKHQQP